MPAPITERLHEQLHKLPGMPPHSEADRLNQNLGARHLSGHNHSRHPALAGRHPALRNRNGHHARPPRILVGWQNWIAGLFTRGAGRG
ncbi:MAG: hypothetical protein ACLP0J_19395 [Solirubrobacteraceae bacterium]